MISSHAAQTNAVLLQCRICVFHPSPCCHSRICDLYSDHRRVRCCCYLRVPQSLSGNHVLRPKSAISSSPQLLRQPMMFLPRALSATADARNALARLTLVFHSETLSDVPFIINPGQEHALQAADVTFEWENLPSNKDGKGKLADVPSSEATLTGPFKVRDINMCVRRGSLVAIVGRVGSGKSSLLQGLIGEMRKCCGEFSFGGRVAYCPQSAWIQNASLVCPIQLSTISHSHARRRGTIFSLGKHLMKLNIGASSNCPVFFRTYTFFLTVI